MPVELSKIKGLMLGKKEFRFQNTVKEMGIDGNITIVSDNIRYDKDIDTFNEYITQQGQKKIQLNREETARELYNLFRCPCGQSHISWENLKLHQRRYWDKKVDTLEAKLDRLLEDI